MPTGASEGAGIVTSGSCSAGTATAADVLSGVTFPDGSGGTTTGTMINQGTWSLSGASAIAAPTFPGAGYYAAISNVPGAASYCAGTYINGTNGTATCASGATTGTTIAAAQVCSGYSGYNLSGTAINGSALCPETGTPSTISNLKFWLKADSMSRAYANGATARTWRDDSGNMHDVLNRTGTYPTYLTSGIGGVQAFYNAGNTCLDTGSIPSDINFEKTDPFSLAVVFRPTGNIGGTNWLMSTQAFGGGTGWYIQYNSNSIGFVFSVGGIYWYRFWSPTLAINNDYIFIVTTDGTNATGFNAYWNGSLLSAGATQSDAIGSIKGGNPLTIGGRASCDTPMTGNISESLIYSGVLGSTDRSALECYLSSKYSIAIGHGC